MRMLRGCLSALFGTSLLLTSCGAAEPVPVSQVPLRVAYSSRWGDYTMIIARDAGFFTKYNLAVELAQYDISHDALVDMAAGDIDGALMAIGDAINVDNRREIKVVALSDDGGDGSIIASPAIATLADLKGKRIGVQLGTWQEQIISEMLASAGLNASDVMLSNVPPEDIPQALGPEIDAGFTWEPYTSTALAKDNRIILNPTEITGLFPRVIAFQQSVAAAHPEQVRAFLKAWFEATEFRQQHPDEAAQIIAKHYGISKEAFTLDPGVRLFDRLENYAYFQGNASGGQPSLTSVTRSNADYLMQIGVLTKMPDLQDLLDPSYLQ